MARGTGRAAGRGADRAARAGAGAGASGSASASASGAAARARGVRAAVGAGGLRRGAGGVAAVVSVSQEDSLKETLGDLLLDSPQENAANRVAVNEVLSQLEQLNPTPAPAVSPLLCGDWDFKYVGTISPGPVPSPTREIALLFYAGGYSPGKFALELAAKLPGQVVKVDPELTLSISTDQPRGKVSCAVTALGSRQEVMLRTSIEPETDIRLRETYMDVEVAGRDVSLPSQARYERTLYVTYLDDELMIARDETGTPDVLMRRPGSSTGSDSGSASASPEEPTEVKEPEIVDTAAGGEAEEGGSGKPDYTW